MIKLAGNTFFIYNKGYPKARLALYNSDNLGTYDQGLDADQLWILRVEPNSPGYYYIENVKLSNKRVARRGNGTNDVKIFSGLHSDDQLWKFVEQGEGYYFICNKKYPVGRLCKNGSDDSSLGMCNEGLFSHQMWKLVPRYTAAVMEIPICVDERKPDGGGPKLTFTVKTGIAAKNSKTFSARTGFKKAIENALLATVSNLGLSPKIPTLFADHLESSMSYESDMPVAKTTEIMVKRSTSESCTIFQYVASFEGPLEGDNCSLYGNYKVRVG